MPEPPSTRPAREGDGPAAAKLIYLTSPDGFNLFGGDRSRGVRLIERAFATPGTDCSRDVVTVAELGDEVAGAMAAFPSAEGDARRWLFVRVAMSRRAPWRWPRMVRVARHGARHSPAPPGHSFYIDSLATAERFRRRGVAAALLDAAERAAHERGLAAVALDTRSSNTGARALYERYGYEVHVEVPESPPIPALVGYVKRLG